MGRNGKCQSCGDIHRLINYNGSDSCPACLSMDREGVSRSSILDNILGKNEYKLRRNRKRDREVSFREE